MTPQQKNGLTAGAAILVAVLGLWIFWGADQWRDRQQDQVLSDLTAVIEENTPEESAARTSAPPSVAEDDTTSTSVSAGESDSAVTTDTSTGEEEDGEDGASQTGSDTVAPDIAETTTTETTTTEASSTDTTSTTTTTTTTTDPTTSTETTEADTTTPPPPADQPTVATFEIVETIPHDTGAFTQGLEISNGRLFESTGLVGQSSIRELDLNTGEVIRNTAVPEVFAEGLTIVGDTAIQLTWQDEIAFRYDLETFEVIDSYAYDGQGWGLCLADEGSGNLIMSDGSSELEFRDPDTFESLGFVEVLLDGAPIVNLNELECVGNTVWANIWLSSLIIEIDPATGDVLTVLEADSLRPESTDGDSGAVWNGLAYDPTDGTLLVTGKRWPTIFRLALTK